MDNQVLLIKLAASNAEDLYIKKLQFRVDSNSDDVAVKQATLKTGTVVNALTTAGSTLGWQDDSSNPGFVEWTFSGNSRPKVSKNGTLYAGLYIDFASSQQQAVSGQTPKFVLTNVEAEGLATISASGTGGNLVNASGIVLQAGGTAAANSTFVDSTEDTAGTPVASATATTLVTAGNTTTAVAGDVIFVDENADGTWDPASEELMVVLNDGGANYTVVRGAFGTTAQASYTAGRNIYVLNTANFAGTNNLVGNDNQTFNTKPTFAVSADSPTGQTAGATGKVIFKFNVTATPNTEDVSSNDVTLTYIDVTTVKSGLTVTNLKMYPADFDNNANYATTCSAISASKWRCQLSTLGATIPGYNIVTEGLPKTWVVRADVGSGVGTTNTLETYIASLGSINSTVGSPSDVVWADGTTTAYWVYQPGATEVKAANALTLGASSGTTDATAPVISTIQIVDAAENNNLALGDTVVLTFSEAIDPTTISASLVPGGSAVAITDGATGDLSANDTAGAGNDFLRIKNIIDVSVGNDTWVTADGGTLAGANTATLNAAGTVLTLMVSTAITGDGEAGATQTVVAGSGGTTVKDVNGTAMTAAGSNGATVSSDAI